MHISLFLELANNSNKAKAKSITVQLWEYGHWVGEECNGIEFMHFGTNNLFHIKDEWLKIPKPVRKFIAGKIQTRNGSVHDTDLQYEIDRMNLTKFERGFVLFFLLSENSNKFSTFDVAKSQNCYILSFMCKQFCLCIYDK